jgi:hypothetical protein
VYGWKCRKLAILKGLAGGKQLSEFRTLLRVVVSENRTVANYGLANPYKQRVSEFRHSQSDISSSHDVSEIRTQESL